MTRNSQAASASNIHQTSQAIVRPKLLKTPIPIEQSLELENHSASKGTTDTESLKPCVGPQQTTDADIPPTCVRPKSTAEPSALATDADIKNVCIAITNLRLKTA